MTTRVIGIVSRFNTRRLGPRPRPADELRRLPLEEWTDEELLHHRHADPVRSRDARALAVRRNLL